MTRPQPALLLLICLYFIIAILAVLRTLETHNLDLFTAGVIPVLIGILWRTPWANLVLKIYIAIQTLGFVALGATGIIAYQITPEDVKVVLFGRNIPMSVISIVVIVFMLFQWWVAFRPSTKHYLSSSEVKQA
ncbi:hypothetical protein [Shewanella sp. Isolate11]|uniref:hypothetical protein n=1 Tax=Shewanella sp. Isolate11 TaxID=2908530 RepID=UPI001EFDD4C8|nr:hypothetical protein [Shewanella sp. Isolate11]MCG9695518.1 hypothetical protein [Shewanella sp. Isolate11]